MRIDQFEFWPHEMLNEAHVSIIGSSGDELDWYILDARIYTILVTPKP